jgi:hypothetical protein
MHMESEPATQELASASAARLRPVWRSTMELKEGLVLAKPVSAASGGYATMQLSAGVKLADETIAQLIVKGIECVAVLNTEPPGAADYGRSAGLYQARLQEIFGAAPNPHCQALFDALLRRGPVPC